MSQPFSRTKLLYISNYYVSNELLNLPSSSEHSILIVGPDLVRREVAIGKGYMERLLKRIVEWCIQEKIIQDQDIIQDLQTSLQNGALVPLAFRIEEYLATKQLKEQCLHAVLSSDNQVRKIHRDLVRVPHRGYMPLPMIHASKQRMHSTSEVHSLRFILLPSHRPSKQVRKNSHSS